MYLVAGVLAAVIESQIVWARSGRRRIDRRWRRGADDADLRDVGKRPVDRRARCQRCSTPAAPWYDVYRTADDKWLAVGALEDQFYAELLRILGIDAADGDRTDPARWPQLRERFADIFAGRTRDEWTDAFDGSDACVSPVLSMTEASVAAEHTARDVFVDIDGIRQPSPAPRFSRTRLAVPTPPARVGEHTADILEGLQPATSGRDARPAAR